MKETNLVKRKERKEKNSIYKRKQNVTNIK